MKEKGGDFLFSFGFSSGELPLPWGCLEQARGRENAHLANYFSLPVDTRLRWQGTWISGPAPPPLPREPTLAMSRNQASVVAHTIKSQHSGG